MRSRRPPTPPCSLSVSVHANKFVDFYLALLLIIWSVTPGKEGIAMGEHHRQKERANPAAPVANIVTYVPKRGKEAELLKLVQRHEPALRKTGLVTAEPFRVWKAYDIRKEREQFIEYFEWRDGKASDTAHQTPEVMAVWEPMGPLLEELTICEVEQL